MALQVWLPLNGNLNNQGLSNYQVTNTNAIINTNGKIGECYQFGIGQSYLELPKECMRNLSTECTVSFWLKILTRNTSWATYFQAGLGGVQWNNYVFGFLRNGSGNKCCFTVSGEAGTSSGSFVTSDMELDTWYHITLVYQTGHCLIYMNGMLYHDYPTEIVPAFNNITTITIGCANTKTNYQSNCLLNDFRIYDHCLSPREVKEISKGLVLHYPLNRGGFGQDNLVNGLYAGGRTTVNNGIVTALLSQNSDCYFHFTCSEDLLAENEYTISMDVSGFSGSDKYLVCGIINQNSGQDITMRNGKCFAIFSPSSNITAGTKIIIDDRNRATSGLTDLTIRNIKVEHGSIPTPWIPNQADDLYSQMGLDNNIEYDVSGYGNNGTKNGITYDSDTPRYQVCSVLDGTSYIKIDTNEWMVHGAQALTWSIWAYSDDWSTETDGGRLVSCTESGGFNIEGGASGYLRVPFYVFKDSKGSSKGYVYYNSSIQLASLAPGWHLFTTTYSTSEINTYVDGVLTHSYSYTSYGIGFNKNARLFLGCEANTANPYTPYFKGKLADFRLYYTTLSAEDVYNLYAVGASLSDTGVLFSNEVSEV